MEKLYIIIALLFLASDGSNEYDDSLALLKNINSKLWYVTRNRLIRYTLPVL